MAIFLCLLPYMVLVFPLLDYVADDLQICAVYMFTRYDRRVKWYFSKLGKLASLTFLSGARLFWVYHGFADGVRPAGDGQLAGNASPAGQQLCLYADPCHGANVFP